jgi:hypothetical protein
MIGFVFKKKSKTENFFVTTPVPGMRFVCPKRAWTILTYRTKHHKRLTRRTLIYFYNYILLFIVLTPSQMTVCNFLYHTKNPNSYSDGSNFDSYQNEKFLSKCGKRALTIT